MFVRGQDCKRTCKTPNYYEYSNANNESEMVSTGEQEDIHFYQHDTQKYKKFAVTANTVYDMIAHYMT